jgi:hypothetical protein
MSLRRALLVVTAFAVATFFIFWLWQNPTPTSQPGPDQTNSATTSDSSRANTAPGMDEAAMSTEQRRQLRIDTMRDLLEMARAEPGNLQRTLQQLRQQCGQGDDCAALIQAALDALPDQDFAALVASALARLPLYEAAMAQVVMSMETPARQRYAAIHTLRQQTLGVAETEALFGQEAAWAEYQFRFGELMSSDTLTSLSPQQRLAALDALRSDTLGDYQPALAEVEGDSGRYDRELALLTAGLTDPASIDAITGQLREQYFGTEQAAAMAARDQVVRQQQTAVAEYQLAVEQLDQDMAPLKTQMAEDLWNLSYEQRLTELRLQYFPSP